MWIYLVRLEVSPETRPPVLCVLVHLCAVVSESSTIDDQRWGSQFVEGLSNKLLYQGIFVRRQACQELPWSMCLLDTFHDCGRSPTPAHIRHYL